jgi:aryl-alcohol dehydrogenase-like predicted oxidoreductase
MADLVREGKVEYLGLSECSAQDLRRASAIHEIAVVQTLGISPAQLALAWVMAQGTDVVPTPGTRNVQRLEENIASAANRLSPERAQEIASLISAETVAGTRFPSQFFSRQESAGVP